MGERGLREAAANILRKAETLLAYGDDLPPARHSICHQELAKSCDTMRTALAANETKPTVGPGEDRLRELVARCVYQITSIDDAAKDERTSKKQKLFNEGARVAYEEIYRLGQEALAALEGQGFDDWWKEHGVYQSPSLAKQSAKEAFEAGEAWAAHEEGGEALDDKDALASPPADVSHDMPPEGSAITPAAPAPLIGHAQSCIFWTSQEEKHCNCGLWRFW